MNSFPGARKFLLVALPFTVALVLSAFLAATASAGGKVNLNDGIELSANYRTWDVTADAGGCISVVKYGYSPAVDSSFDSQSDAFDGGLLLVSENRPFHTRAFRAGTTGDLSGNQLTVGPASFAGFKVTRQDRALPSGILRSLVKLENKAKKPKSATLALDSGLGSDSSTGVRKASNGSKMTKASRWVVTSDSPTTPNDPVITMAFYGKGKPKVKVRSLPLGQPRPSVDCLTVDLGKVKIGARNTGYLLFFTELNSTNQAGISAAKKYDKKTLNSQLLAGLSKGVKKKILNWDL